jgi:predicted dehydrogenase
VEDTASARIQFKNGAKGLFFATNANADNSSVELEVLFEKERFTIKDSILTRVNEAGGKVELMEDAKLPGSKHYYGASHAKTINLFYSAITENTEVYIHAKDALASIAIIDAIHLSSEKKQSIQMEVF